MNTTTSNTGIINMFANVDQLEEWTKKLIEAYSSQQEAAAKVETNKTVEASPARVAQLLKENEELKAKVAHLEKVEQYYKWQKEISEKDQASSARIYRDQISSLEYKNETLRDKIANQDKEISKLQDRVEATERRCGDWRDKFISKEKEVSKMVETGVVEAYPDPRLVKRLEDFEKKFQPLEARANQLNTFYLQQKDVIAEQNRIIKDLREQMTILRSEKASIQKTQETLAKDFERLSCMKKEIDNDIRKMLTPVPREEFERLLKGPCGAGDF